MADENENAEPPPTEPGTPQPDKSQWGWKAVKDATAKASSGLNPLPILREAIKAVPPVRWALGVVGIAAAAFLILGLLGATPWTVFILIILFGLMILLVVFAALGDIVEYLRFPAIILAYVVVALTSLTLVFLFLSVFFNWPLFLQNVLEPEPRISLDNVHVNGTIDTAGNLSVRLIGIPETPFNATALFRRKGKAKPLKAPAEFQLGQKEFSDLIVASDTATQIAPPVECEISVYERGQLKAHIVKDVQFETKP